MWYKFWRSLKQNPCNTIQILWVVHHKLILHHINSSPTPSTMQVTALWQVLFPGWGGGVGPSCETLPCLSHKELLQLPTPGSHAQSPGSNHCPEVTSLHCSNHVCFLSKMNPVWMLRLFVDDNLKVASWADLKVQFKSSFLIQSKRPMWT